MGKKKLKACKSSKVIGTQVLGYVNSACVAYNVKSEDAMTVAESMSQLLNRNYQLAVLRSLAPEFEE